MRLSVIIVNYNVKYFLEQCLCSVRKAMDSAPWETEVIVIDNQSTDESITYLQPKFPFVQFIVNKENIGFARANNQALKHSSGEYILFLNPDTIVPEDCFVKSIDFMESHPAAGALGIRMIDGSGQYLKESKRGFPSPWVSFCKMSGLTTLFPASTWFAGYYLGHLPSTENHMVDVLAGAFMLVKKTVLDQAGGFDERFFMYAEDIDLSYRIQLAGYQNYYCATSTIIHFKGESTRKDARYVKLFYEAMILFVRKHFRGSISWWYVKLLEMAIRVKANFHQPKSDAGTPKAPSISVAILGDEPHTAILHTTLSTRKDTMLVENPQEAGMLVYCEGPGFTFKQVIAQLEVLPPGKQAFIHGGGTKSLVGSHSKDNQGAVIVV